MRDVIESLSLWWFGGESTAVATVVGVSRSAPRQPGASMLVGPGGEAVGSVSGGCVEGAVFELSAKVRSHGGPARHRYGFSDDEAFTVGLTCGGEIDVFIEKVNQVTFPLFGAVSASVVAGIPIALATVVGGPPANLGQRLVVSSDKVEGTTGSTAVDAAVGADARALLEVGNNGMLQYGLQGQRLEDDLDIFVESFAPAPRMLIFGAVDFASSMATMGAFIGYRVSVCDARATFATPSRFPGAHEVVVDWPHRYLEAESRAGRIDSRTVLCILTHDPKFDVPLLEVALRLPAVAYIGAMGSRLTNEDRRGRLLQRGVTEVEMDRISSPIGLDLGGRTPEQTAVSIAAEIIALQRGGSGTRLTARTGPIHAPTVGDLTALGPDSTAQGYQA